MKTSIIVIVAIVVVALIGFGVYHYYGAQSNQVGGNNNTSSTAPMAGPGEHCGGNMANPPQCGAGYQCAPDPNSNLPFGDVGGICVSVQAAGY